MKTIKFITLGCKVNQYESQAIREGFLKSGFQEISDGKVADLYIINTCTVTSVADAKSRHFIHWAYQENPAAKIVVTGCAVELDGAGIAKVPEVTHIIKNQDKFNIPELLNEHNEPNQPNQQNQPNQHNEPNQTGISGFSGHNRAFLKIQDGCDNFCSYCILPFVRGKPRSRQLDEIRQEAMRLIQNGFKEIVLTGICLGAYGRDLAATLDLGTVIEELENIEGSFRIRLSSIEAKDINDKLIDKLKISPKLCPHLHIPFQSGDDEILKKMNRRYCARDYLELVEKLKSQIPDIAITTDILVGFPGEAKRNFQNTVDFLKRVKPLRMHIFPFSPRPGTCAMSFDKKVQPIAIKERTEVLESLARELSFAYRKRFLNQDLDILVESELDRRTGLFCGYAQNYIKVSLIDGSQDMANQIVKARIHKIDKDRTWAFAKTILDKP